MNIEFFIWGGIAIAVIIAVGFLLYKIAPGRAE